MAALRILIADDHDVVRRGLRSLVESRPDWKVCGEAVDGRDAIAKTEELRPDVILLDITMPHLNGLEAAKVIRKQVPKTEIILVSQHDSSQVHKAAMDAGVRAFVAKSQVARDLVTALDSIVVDGRNGHLSTKAKETTEPPAARPSGKVQKTKTSVRSDLQWLANGGEVAEIMKSMDWSNSPLGPLDQWPQSLKTTISICLASRFELFIWWGKDLTVLYNDAYRQTLASKHPWALGRPGAEVWREIWDVIGPMLHRVMDTGMATWSDDLQLFLERHGYVEETYHTFSYSPIRDESGGVGGVFTAVAQTTERVIGERRLRTLRDLASSGTDAKGEPESWSAAAEVLSQNPYDIGFAVLYCLSEDGTEAVATGYSGISPDHQLCPKKVILAHPPHKVGTLIAETARTGKAAELKRTDVLGFELPNGVWGDQPQELIVLPISQTGQAQLLGVLVAGVNTRKRLDESYRTFFNLVAGQIAKGVADAMAYEQTRKRAEALAELDRAKTTFFGNVSHEFRTPLTLMLGPLDDILAKQNSLLAEDRDELEVVRRNGLRLLKLVNSLLDFSRIEAGRVQAMYQPTDLSALTAELGSMFRSAMDRAGLNLVVDCQPLPEPVYVDRDMWEKVVLNLLSNAFKFTFEGEVRLGLHASGRHVELTVEDTGIGIPEAELPRLFERFHRVEGSRGRTHEGTGIGLALLQELVKLHGGFVHVKSSVGRGSIFTVSIPLGKAHLPADRVGGVRTQASTALRADTYVQEALRWLPEDSATIESSGVIPDVVPGAAPSDFEPTAGAGRPLIVLADDNADMREYVRRLLLQHYRVHAVSNGEEALKAIRELKPDLILTDIMMPVVDGFGVLQAVRDDPETKAKPVILLSARAGEEARVEGLHAGADDYLVKPFTARELLARVGSHLKMSRIRHEAAELERRLRAEADLERSRLREVFLQAPGPILMLTGPDFRVEFVNEAYVAAAGRKAIDDIQDKLLFDAIPELRDQQFPELFATVYRTGEPFMGREWMVMLNRDGQLRPTYFNFIFQPIRDVSGNVTSILVHAHEVTDQVVARTGLEQRVRERTSELEQAEESLRALSGRLLQIQDEERRRIARELHDSAGQLLAALGMNLIPLQAKVEKLGPDAVRVANESVALVDELTKELRTISHLLHPPMLDEAGLDLALQWFVEGFGERSKISVQFDRTPDLGRLPREIETTIFRIVQESLTNIHRHSGSTTALVRITRDGDLVQVEVADRGKGIRTDKDSVPGGVLRPGVGIQGMKERVRQLKGNFEIRSNAEGTSVSVTLPLSPTQKQKPAQEVPA